MVDNPLNLPCPNMPELVKLQVASRPLSHTNSNVIEIRYTNCECHCCLFFSAVPAPIPWVTQWSIHCFQSRGTKYPSVIISLRCNPRGNGFMIYQPRMETPVTMQCCELYSVPLQPNQLYPSALDTHLGLVPSDLRPKYKRLNFPYLCLTLGSSCHSTKINAIS
ncbi:hypothetical protein BDV37DRAFT_194864 [Aspergillus pseudonomiae]|uniref:Uncharacterized protein n=1 Tax=Aspergillus pseudonomiae TaxID=1506151 RepID=A0A5N7D3W7_9EURO|nr:uncharacterized protein BDV37DRAFT_194864 [Aspergillus pseudonomiae]KAE8400949.1 hypothetical protein BDV37DRAFT_194864 [Aspergillus pseudonomiae]